MRLKITVTLEKVRQSGDSASKDMPKVDASTYIDSQQGFVGTAMAVADIFKNVWERFRVYEQDFRRG